MRFFFLFIISFIVVSAQDFLHPIDTDRFVEASDELKEASEFLDNIKIEINSYVITREGHFRFKFGFLSWVSLHLFLTRANDLYCNLDDFYFSREELDISLKDISEISKKESDIRKALYDIVPPANRIEFYGTADAGFIKDSTKLISSSLACVERRIKIYSSQ